MMQTADQHELSSFHHQPAGMEEEEREQNSRMNAANHDDYDAFVGGLDDHKDNDNSRNHRLQRRTLRKLDFILLPFLSLLFLLNSLDKSNIGNAETAGFTRDTGLDASDVNVSMAVFFAIFVSLQPVGAALGRKFGMKRWVPACMSLWGLCTIGHIFVRKRWQLVLLRALIASLEAGFYPTTVSYLSMFYTRYEFAVRLGFFYGQTAVAGALGGVLSWAVFSHFPQDGGQQPRPPDLPPPDRIDSSVESGNWRSWEVLFLIEGCTTMAVALLGFFWLPHSADTAWFFNSREQQWAEHRIRLDKDVPVGGAACADSLTITSGDDVETMEPTSRASGAADDEGDAESYDRLLGQGHSAARRKSTFSAVSVTHDAGLTRHDVLSAVLNYKIWYLLVCNILSAIPATAFGVFLPLVIKQLSPRLDLSAASSNLLTAPPFAFGALALFIFTRWSDRSHARLVPILYALALLLIGLTLTVMSPISNYVLRYISLCVLLSGSYIASPLTVAWLANNTPEPGKRAILLGINGWGNLAGVFSSLLFTPEDAHSGYVRPFVVTLICVLASFAGFAGFRALLVRENAWRDVVTGGWDEDQRQREEVAGDVTPVDTRVRQLWQATGFDAVVKDFGLEDDRRGDEKMTFRYGL